MKKKKHKRTMGGEVKRWMCEEMERNVYIHVYTKEKEGGDGG